jgi:hypothetical protein
LNKPAPDYPYNAEQVIVAKKMRSKFYKKKGIKNGREN